MSKLKGEKGRGKEDLEYSSDVFLFFFYFQRVSFLFYGDGYNEKPLSTKESTNENGNRLPEIFIIIVRLFFPFHFYLSWEEEGGGRVFFFWQFFRGALFRVLFLARVFLSLFIAS